MSTTRRLLGLVAPYRGGVALAVVLTALACVLNLPAPLLIQGLVDRVVTDGNLAALPTFAAALLAVFAGQAAVAMATAWAIGPVGLGVVRDLRHALYARLQRLGLAFYDRTPTGAILSRADGRRRRRAVGHHRADAGDPDRPRHDGRRSRACCWPATRGWRRRSALCCSPTRSTFRAFARRIRAGSLEVRERLDGVFGQLKERLDGVLVVRAYAREEAEIVEFAGRIGAAHGPAGPRRTARRGVLESERGAQRGRHGDRVRRRGLRGRSPAG